jgi:hypothetical protein
MCPIWNLMWDIYNLLYGTHKIMPFTSKYNHMGHTERIRIPQNCVSHIENLLEHYNRLCGTHNEQFILKIQTKIENGLDDIE